VVVVVENGSGGEFDVLRIGVEVLAIAIGVG